MQSGHIFLTRSCRCLSEVQVGLSGVQMSLCEVQMRFCDVQMGFSEVRMSFSALQMSLYGIFCLCGTFSLLWNRNPCFIWVTRAVRQKKYARVRDFCRIAGGQTRRGTANSLIYKAHPSKQENGDRHHIAKVRDFPNFYDARKGNGNCVLSVKNGSF